MTQNHVDIETGEIVRLLPLADDEVVVKRKYLYPGGYVTMGVIHITKLVNANLPADGYKLALIMATQAVPVTGLVSCTNADYAKELGVTANRVSRLKGLLADIGFIHRAGPKLVMVNPGWCFKGTPEQQLKAMETWAKIHPLGGTK